ncbi:MAG TPA: hypothetical protein VGC37_00350 [Friedmanniella sp.]
MDDLRLTRQLVANGLTAFGIRSELRRGNLHRVRRGVYSGEDATDPAQAHRRLLAATLAQTQPGAVVSHGSAAVLHGLPVAHAALERVHLTRDRQGGGQQRRWVQVHGHRLGPADVWTIDGRAVTSPPRTVVDLACTLPIRDAVATGDAALRDGAELGELLAVLERVGPRRGVAAARRVLALLDPSSESYGESVSRVLLHEHGVVPPMPQTLVYDRRGTFVGRVDFAWPALGVIGEFDGRIKYGRELEPEEDPVEVLWGEKQREDRLRELGWLVVRWLWADLHHPEEWMARLARALERGRNLPAPAGHWATSARFG